MRRLATPVGMGLVVLAMLSGALALREAVASGKMYWTDSATDKIQRANLDGSRIEDLVTTGLQAPWGIALDTTKGKMYWTDAGTGKIQRANLDGSRVEDLIMTYSSGPAAGGGKRRGLALDLGK
jgi:sugar lactone lactonase YvrE